MYTCKKTKIYGSTASVLFEPGFYTFCSTSIANGDGNQNGFHLHATISKPLLVGYSVVRNKRNSIQGKRCMAWSVWSFGWTPLHFIHEYTKCVIHQSAISLPDRCGRIVMWCVQAGMCVCVCVCVHPFVCIVMSACGSSLLMAKPYYGRWDGKPPSSGNGQIAVQVDDRKLCLTIAKKRDTDGTNHSAFRHENDFSF